jgi:hypothetical protein
MANKPIVMSKLRRVLQLYNQEEQIVYQQLSWSLPEYSQ